MTRCLRVLLPSSIFQILTLPPHTHTRTHAQDNTQGFYAYTHVQSTHVATLTLLTFIKETMGCMTSHEVLNSKSIDRMIKEDAKRLRSEVRLLLLGQSSLFA